MVNATSTLCTAVFPDLGLRLAAGVTTPIPDDQVKRVATFPGVEITPESDLPSIHPFEEA